MWKIVVIEVKWVVRWVCLIEQSDGRDEWGAGQRVGVGPGRRRRRRGGQARRADAGVQHLLGHGAGRRCQHVWTLILVRQTFLASSNYHKLNNIPFILKFSLWPTDISWSKHIFLNCVLFDCYSLALQFC